MAVRFLAGPRGIKDRALQNDGIYIVLVF